MNADKTTARQAVSAGWASAAQPTILKAFAVGCAALTHPTTGDERLEAEEDGVDDTLFGNEGEDEDDCSDYVPPPLTPEIMARMFANMRENGLL